MLKRLKFDRFRGFEDFTLDFGHVTYLVGPNNAGKSTILTALRVIEAQLRVAQARMPHIDVDDKDGAPLSAYSVGLDDFPGLPGSARYDFGSDEAKVWLDWENGASCCLLWPKIKYRQETPDPYFFLRYANGGQPGRPADVSKFYSPLGVVPTLGPVDDEEPLRDQRYVRRNLSSKLSSRHFRNQLWLLKEEKQLPGFLKFASQWTDELELVDVIRRADSTSLDAFYKEGPRRLERELVWAGDGLQVWLQILYHVYRTRALPTLILDEPEVFLHPDLQRRLVRLLVETGRQTIVASHSSELLGEVDADTVVLIDRSLQRGRRIRDERGLSAISHQLGSTFNLRMAKALKSRVVVFVEGKDRRLLAKSARTLGLENIAADKGVAFVPMDGFDGHQHIDAFEMLCHDYLRDSVRLYVLLDRDYRPEVRVLEVSKKLSDRSLSNHIWSKKELENYYLDIGTMASMTSSTVKEVEDILTRVTEPMKSLVSSRLVHEKMEAEVNKRMDRATILQRWQEQFDGWWADLSYRLDRAPAKDVLAGFNRALQAGGRKAISFDAIAATQGASSVDAELAGVLEEIEELIKRSSS